MKLNTSVKTIAVIGNAPISSPHGAEVDESDLVIRMNQCQVRGFEQLIGSKTDVYATYPSECVNNWKMSDLKSLPMPLACWMVRTHSRCLEEQQFAEWASLSCFTGIEYMSDNLWHSIIIAMGLTDAEASARRMAPSTGFSVLLMAACHFPDSTIKIVGITGRPQRGWYWGVNRNISQRHDWQWEAKQLDKLRGDGRIRVLDYDR